MPFGLIGCKKSGSLKINFSQASKTFQKRKGTWEFHLGSSLFFPFYFITLNHGKETSVTFY
jgi:hypothetical protein